MDAKEQEAYDAGILAQRLKEFDKHFATINGSIGDTARELSQMREELKDVNLSGSEGFRAFKKEVTEKLESFINEVRTLSNDFRTFKEDYRVREAALQSEKRVLVAETERRRSALADERAAEADERAEESESFMHRHSTAGLALTILALLLGGLYFLLSHLP